jgi:hypothetical protein
MGPVKMIDPETGLELEVLTPAPASWSQDSVRGRMMESPPPIATGPVSENPFLTATNTVPPLPNPDTAAAAQAVGLPADGPVMGGGSGGTLRPSSLLDKVMHTVFGTPDSMLSPEEEAEVHARRKSASAMSRSAAENPGEDFMDIPSTGGNSLGESLSFMPKLIKGLGGLF